MTKIGKELSVEPVVGIDEPYVLTEADLPVLYEEYDKLARAYLQKRREGDAFDFFHFNVALDNGPCVAKRLAGCGAGHEYFAITPEGDIYPCHQFVGREEYKLGTLETGVVKPDLVQKFRHTHVMTKTECSTCWARFSVVEAVMLMLILSMVTSASHINMAVNCRKNGWNALSCCRRFWPQKRRKVKICVPR